MKRIVPAIILTISTFAFTQTKTNTVYVSTGFLTGKDYLDLTAAEKRAYGMGVINGMLNAPMFGAPQERMSWLRNCTNKMTDEQIAAIITKYVNDRPSEWHYALNAVSLNAMIVSCPQATRQ